MKRTLYMIFCLVVVMAMVACNPATPTAAPVAPAEPTTAAPGTVPEVQPTTPPAAQPQPTTPPAAEDPDADKFGGTLILAEGAIKQFDPVFCSDDPSFHSISNIFSFLTREVNGKIVPDLATSWEFQDGGKTLVFNLRQGVMFHDDNEVFAKGASREVVAEDVVYSIKRMVETEGTMAPADLLSSYENVEALDKYTVKLTMKDANALILNRARGLTSTGIVPKEAIELLGDDFAQNPVGSGPFKFSEYLPDDHLTLVRNDLYWKKPYLDEVVYKIIPDESVSILALESGEVDYAGLPTSEFERLSSDENFTLLPVTVCPVMTQLMFDIGVEPYSDQKFREAVSYALDGPGIGKNVTKDMYVEGCGTAGPGIPGFNEDLCKYFTYDPEQSKALLAELGYADTNNDGILDKGGSPLKLELEIWNFSPMPQYGAAIVSQLKEVGIDVELQTVEFGTFIDDWNAGPGKMMTMAGWCGDGGTNGLWGRTGWGPELNYIDEELFTLLEDSNAITDPADRDEAIQQAADLIYSRYWAIPMGFEYFYQIANKRVNDFSATMWFQNLVTEENNVWLSEK